MPTCTWGWSSSRCTRICWAAGISSARSSSTPSATRPPRRGFSWNRLLPRRNAAHRGRNRFGLPCRTGDIRVSPMADSTDIPPPPRKSFFAKVKRGLFMTHTEILEKLGAAVKEGLGFDESVLESLEEALIEADVGAETAG